MLGAISAWSSVLLLTITFNYEGSVKRIATARPKEAVRRSCRSLSLSALTDDHVPLYRSLFSFSSLPSLFLPLSTSAAQDPSLTAYPVVLSYHPP